MDVAEAVTARRSVKKFRDRPLTRDEIEPLLELAAQAPNHHLTQPWRFYVLGPESRRKYGLALGQRKARKVADPAAANLVREKVAREHEALPAMLAVAMVEAADPETREEDYAATMMAVENLLLAAVDRGLGTHIKTGAIMSDPAARAAVGVGENERIVAIINLGEPEEQPQPKPRRPVGEFIHWVP